MNDEITAWKNKWECAVKMAARAAVERDEARTELEMWRDGNIMHKIHRDELEKTERERDEAREALRELWQTADAYIPQIDEEQTTKWHNAMFGNSKNG